MMREECVSKKPKKRINLCYGCPDNVDRYGRSEEDVVCDCAGGASIERVYVIIDPQDKNRNKHCKYRKRTVKA